MGLGMGVVLSGCMLLPPPSPANPMAVLPGDMLSPDVPRAHDTLVILLPGRGARAADFRQRGFFDAAAGHPFDLVAADAHFGYYRERTIIERLHEDVIGPAKAAGYREIWLAGISAGAFGALMYAAAEDVDGLILLAPYPGDRDLVAEISEAGGLQYWDADNSTAGQAHQRVVWRYLQSMPEESPHLKVRLGYGTDDNFASAAELLATTLSSEQVYQTPGGHRWPVWLTLWRDILRTGLQEPLVDSGRAAYNDGVETGLAHPVSKLVKVRTGD